MRLSTRGTGAVILATAAALAAASGTAEARTNGDPNNRAGLAVEDCIKELGRGASAGGWQVNAVGDQQVTANIAGTICTVTRSVLGSTLSIREPDGDEIDYVDRGSQVHFRVNGVRTFQYKEPEEGYFSQRMQIDIPGIGMTTASGGRVSYSNIPAHPVEAQVAMALTTRDTVTDAVRKSGAARALGLSW